MKIISLQMANTDSEITFLTPREDDITINPIAKTIEQQHQLKHEQIEAVLSYVKNDDVCKNQQLLAYFGEKTSSKCGKCSVCLKHISGRNVSQNDSLSHLILKSLESEDLSSRQLLQLLKCSEGELLQSLSELMEIKKIKITKANTYSII